MNRRYVLICPCRDEAAFMRRTLEAIAAQTVPPALCVVVDDGSTDDTPKILAEYAARLPYLRILTRANRGRRAVGPGVIEAFYAGLETVQVDAFEYLCKLDLDLDFHPRYFETLIERMEAEPRLGTFSGKPWVEIDGKLLPEPCGDEMSVGMTKFYRTACFRQTGGFVREVMWDGIDCHRARMLGWFAGSSDAIPELRFQHLRPMGSSQTSIYTGRQRHGFGQWFMGTGTLYMLASSVFRMIHPPYLSGGLSMFWGYMQALLRKAPRYADLRFRRFLRRCQWLMLTRGKQTATRAIADAQAWAFDPRRASVPMGAAPLAELPQRLHGLPQTQHRGLTLDAPSATDCATRIAAEMSLGRGGWLQRFDATAMARYLDEPAYAQLVQRASIVLAPERDAEAMLRELLGMTSSATTLIVHETATGEPAALDACAQRLVLPRWNFAGRLAILAQARAALASTRVVVLRLDSPQQEWLINELLHDFPSTWFLALGLRSGTR